MALNGIHGGANFSGPFLTYTIITTVLALFFFLYFNRVSASLISWAVRQWTWRRYGIYFDVQALQLSLLGGRLFFVGLRYHGKNETILVQNGHITWSYWLRRVRHIDLKEQENGKKASSGGADGSNINGSESAKTRFPCRMNVKLAGLEWFVYNRSPAYDSIIEGLTKGDGDNEHDPLPDVGHGSKKEGQQQSRERRSQPPEGAEKADDTHLHEKTATGNGHAGEKYTPETSPRSSTFDDSGHNVRPSVSRKKSNMEDADKGSLPVFLQLFPIYFMCDKAAMVMGNENTAAILIVKAQGLSGEVNATKTDTPDPYRQTFHIRFERPIIEMRDNEDYREDQVNKAVREKQVAEESEPLPPRSFFRRQRRIAYNHLRNMLPYFRRSVESFTSVGPRTASTTMASAHIPGSSHWQGLSRYLDDPDGDEKTRWSATEYGMLNPLLETPEAVLIIYWDSVAKVCVAGDDSLEEPAGDDDSSAQQRLNINGNEPPPAWGMSLSIRGGSINYGPWADRMRADLQRVFVPSLSKDATPAERLPVGAWRVATQFKLFVELDDEVTVRIPVREASKNWRFKGKETGTKFRAARDKRRTRSRFKKSEPPAAAPSQRSYGWLDIKIAANATVSYDMDQVAGSSGYSTIVKVDLPRAEISSSVNQQVLWRSGAQRITCDLSTPLKWNGLREWRFHMASNDLELFLLRDHVFLLTDLIDDWGSGPPAEYLVFTPFKYFINLSFTNVKLYLNVNDANIINNPTSLDDNAFILISSPLLESTVCIPLDKYCPPSNVIPFTVQTDAASIGLHVPSWNTQHLFLACRDIGHLKNLLIDGKYHYNATTSVSNTDTLVVNVSGREPVFSAHGFVVRYFLKLKDNYFGDDIHFKTLEEYQEHLRLKEADPEAELATRPPHKLVNDFDVMLNVRADEPKMFLPTNIYSASRNVELEAASLTADLRFTNYFMDFDFVLSPLSMSLSRNDGDDDDLDSPMSTMSNTQLFIDGIHAFGDRLFGLPPTEPTYLCNWDLSLGAITGECTTDFLTALVNGGKSFNFTFDDDENALIPYSSIVMHDVTFLRLTVKAVNLWLHVEDAAFLISLGEGVDVKFNDWARSHYSRRADVSIPDIQFSCVNSELAMRHKSRPQEPLETSACLKTGLSIAIVGRKFDFTNERRLQQELVRREDQRTHRASFLLQPEFLEDGFVPDAVEPPAQPVPMIPYPITKVGFEKDGASFAARSASSRSKASLRSRKSQSSFLSASTASQSSIVRPRSSMHSSARWNRPAQSPQGLQPPAAMEPQATAQLNRSSPAHRRDISSSTHQTGFYSFTDGGFTDAGTYNDPRHNTMAFSSKFFAPYFPLEDVKPDITEAAMEGVEDEHGDGDSASDNGTGNGKPPTRFDLSDIDPEMLSEDKIYSSILVRVHSGVSVVLNPESAKHVASLLSALQPSKPEDILDDVQMSSVDDILSAIKHANMKGSVEDLALQLPRASIRLLNSSNLDASDAWQEEQDQYDISVSQVTLMLRSNTTWQDTMRPEETKTQNSFQLQLGSIGISASERLADIPRPQAAFTAAVENVLVSMGTKDLTYLDADIGAIEGHMSSEKIEYIASLIHRTGVLASALTDSFSGPLSYSDRVRPLLARRLIAAGKGVPDPGFLVRPSAVLRSANQHLRTFDSWKLAVRLRQIWYLMKLADKDQLTLACSRPSSSRSAANGGGMHEVLANLDRWRGWDLEDVGRSVLLQKFFGSLLENSRTPRPAQEAERPFMAVARVRRMQLALDPGPKQNEVRFLDLTARFENNGPACVAGVPDMSGLMVGKAVTKSVSILNVYCADAAVRLNWEICELAEDVLKLYKKKTEESLSRVSTNRPESISKGEDKDSSRGQAGKQKAAPPAADESAFHVVLALDHGSVVIDTINLNIRLANDNFKSSLLLRRGAQAVVDTNIITSCDSISCRVKSRSELLMTSQLRMPSVFVAYEIQTLSNSYAHTIKATASSREFNLGVKQEPIVLLQTLDLLVQDEVAQLYRLKDQLPETVPAAELSAPDGPKEDTKTADRLSAFRINVAFFLDHYTISLPLLRSLSYNISGVVARVSMAANFGRELIFDFDVKENSHDMHVTANNVPRSISLLHIPPTNGRITTQFHDTEQTITVFSSLELVQLDASGVYTLLSALNRPEISNTIADAQEQIGFIQGHIAEIFGGDAPGSEAPGPAEQARPLIYSVHSTFAGLEIFGNSPLKSDETPLAHLSFTLDSVKLELANRLDSGGPVLAYPELHVNLRRIAFEIQRGHEQSMSSCGSIVFAALVTATSKMGEDGKEIRSLIFSSDAFDASFSPETISTVVDVLGYMGDKIKDLDTSREMEYLRKLRQSKPRIAINDQEQPDDEEPDIIDSFLSSIAYTFEIRNIQINWLCALATLTPPVSRLPSRPRSLPTTSAQGKEDLVFLLERVELGTRSKNSARLTFENLQLQMVPPTHDKRARSANSALLPEVIFSVAYFTTPKSRRFAFQAVGKTLDLRLTSEFIVPVAHLKDSIQLSIQNVQQASLSWNPTPAALATMSPPTTGSSSPAKSAESPRKAPRLGKTRLESLLVDVDFAGAVAYISGKKTGPGGTTSSSTTSLFGMGDDAGSTRSRRPGGGGKYGQFNTDEPGSSTVLRSPGLAWKLEYRDTGRGDPSLYAEVKVDASSNVLYPSVVPLVMDLTSSIQAVVSSSGKASSPVQKEEPEPEEEQANMATGTSQPKPEEPNYLLASNPMLGRLKLNLGLRICKQQFSLSCQPIARVAAMASFEDVYLTMNTVRSTDQGNFVAISGNFTRLQASVQHVYSRESTGSFEVESMVLSLMNSKHVSGVSGVSALLKVSPMKVAINAKQLQDFLLFREIWTPRDIRKANAAEAAATMTAEATASSSASQQPFHLVQRYQQVAATAAFPWTATIAIAALEINVDLGQALGKPVFIIENLWVSSKKTSDWEQNLCLGFSRVAVESTGRMSGFVTLEDLRLRSSIEWPAREQALNDTPLIQASVYVGQLRLKASFDYQAFLVADITALDFLMYNVRQGHRGLGDRLVATFDCDAVQVFGTATSAAQGLALYQAFLRLVQERKANYESSLRDIEKFTRRRSSATVLSVAAASRRGAASPEATDSEGKQGSDEQDDFLAKSPISLDTDVMVTLKALNLGVFPSTFGDHQVFKMEAANAQARFSASIEEQRIHSDLGLTLGQLRIGLAGVRYVPMLTEDPDGPPKAVNDMTVEDVVLSATGSRGGTILKVPRFQAGMQTWQRPDSRHIDYIFKSALEGKVEVGWNYSRISYIRGMWANHTRTLAQTWGRKLPMAIRVTGVPEGDESGGGGGGSSSSRSGRDANSDKKDAAAEQQTKITAEVNVPQSKYEYRALEPPIIETPQLRDMGEATPPLEWIGLHRDRLPNLTHQIVIVSLLELAGEVEDAYSRILGSS